MEQQLAGCWINPIKVVPIERRHFDPQIRYISGSQLCLHATQVSFRVHTSHLTVLVSQVQFKRDRNQTQNLQSRADRANQLTTTAALTKDIRDDCNGLTWWLVRRRSGRTSFRPDDFPWTRSSTKSSYRKRKRLFQELKMMPLFGA